MAKPLAQLAQDDAGNWDEQALLSIAGVSVFLGLTVYSVVTGKPFNTEGFGIGFGAVMAATLGGMGWRDKQRGKDAQISDQPGG